ncbi:ketopantoate reductase family protein [Hyalangium sp.]|uniref:ketopantoate reductase family protein n=1 Tax=Hyalangium sp. TaxID=2028555 RepID=UPI002D37124D|nr:2-dehydropantoate 2-reductase N-terminal domain-containing protein [Hyalangium sp.]HYH99645.1 2-dehydropantoate 2-reductase N-terminal domain-containing protein [Hyalangium sp.]
MSTKPRVLLVGAGAIGQVFGWFLQSAGCEISFLVKEKHAEEARRGFTLYELGLFKRSPAPMTFSGFGVHVSTEEVAAQRWDQVWLCVSSTALRAGSWVDALARVTGEATWVMHQPGLHDRDWLSQRVSPGRLVAGMVPFLSFHAPLRPGASALGPGTAFWFPPLSRGLFSGPEERLQQVLRTLRAGGYPARRHRDVARAIAVPSAVLTTFVDGLAAAGWSFERFLAPESLAQVHRAAQEAVRIAAWHTQQSAALLLPLLRPLLFKVLLPLASRMVPLDFEAYLEVHFTKVGEQTRLMVREYLELGSKAGLPVEALRASTERPPKQLGGG